MQMDNLRDLYIDELKDLYNAEKQLLKALPKIARNATDPNLRKAFSDHSRQTEVHVQRLDQIFEILGTSPRGKRCKGMEGLIAEAQDLLGEDAQDDVLDAGLISKAQHVEHYEIAGYGTVRAYALTLGEADQAELLQQTLNEEEQTDRLLTVLAEGSINVDAAIGDDASEERSTRRSRGEREVTRTVTSEKRPAKGGGTPARKRKSRASISEARSR